jgi:hypothetical protein
MKKSELKAIIKRELLKEGFDGFNGVVSLGATNRMTSLTEMEDEVMYGDVTPDVSDEDIAIVIEDALDKIEDMGMSVGENAREIQAMINRAIAARSF